MEMECIIMQEYNYVHLTESVMLIVFRRNAMHCISPYAIVARVYVCVSMCMPRLWTPGKRLEIETSIFF